MSTGRISDYEAICERWPLAYYAAPIWGPSTPNDILVARLILESVSSDTGQQRALGERAPTDKPIPPTTKAPTAPLHGLNTATVPVDFSSLLERVEIFQRDVELRGTTDWLAFSGAVHSCVGTERQFMESMFNYLYGFHLETQGRENDSLEVYAGASHFLSHCNHPVPLTATRMISYKLNWLSRLSDSTESSVFFYLNHFFGDKNYRDPRCAAVLNTRTDGLLVGENTTLFFEAVSKYLASDYEAALHRVLHISRSSPLNGDPHFYYRLKLLQARLAQVLDNEDPKLIYRLLLTHPNFGGEAREYIDSIE